jgi:hypothetical protein
VKERERKRKGMCDMEKHSSLLHQSLNHRLKRFYGHGFLTERERERERIKCRSMLFLSIDIDISIQT